MKSNLFLWLFVMMLITGCQKNVRNETIDLEVIEMKAISLIERYQDAVFTKNLEALSETLADDGFFYGSDPTEVWSKQEMIGLWQASFADSTFDPKYTVELRKINISSDGHSVIIMQHAAYPGFSSKIKVRQTYHLTSKADNLQFDYIDWAVLFRNEDFGKVNAAL